MYEQELYHHGTKGQKWGVRRYQNSDGSLTPEGKKRYGSGLQPGTMKYERKRQKAYEQSANKKDKALAKAHKAEEKWEKFQRNDKPPYSDKKWTKLQDKRTSTNDEFWNQEKLHRNLMKSMKMTKKEQNYREALKNYNDYINGKTLSTPVRALTFGAARPAILASTKKGKQLENELGKASNNYRYEQGRKIEEHADNLRAKYVNQKPADKAYKRATKTYPSKKQIERYGW